MADKLLDLSVRRYGAHSSVTHSLTMDLTVHRGIRSTTDGLGKPSEYVGSRHEAAAVHFLCDGRSPRRITRPKGGGRRSQTVSRAGVPAFGDGPTVGDEVRATLDGEFGRVRQRGHELAALLTVLVDSVPDVLQSTEDANAIAGRLHALVQTGVAALSDLAELAGRLQALASVRVDLD